MNEIIEPLMNQEDAAKFIADYLRLSVRHVYDRYFHLPSFPKPDLYPSATGKRPIKRWHKQSIAQWIESQKMAA